MSSRKRNKTPNRPTPGASPVGPGALVYRGSPKHKNRPADGSKGTLCPEWTHRSASGGLGNDMFAHDWITTEAHLIFLTAVVHANGRRFATARGLAFEAKPSADETWHGYPIPWEAVPPEIKNIWLDDGSVDRRSTKLFQRVDDGDIHWALRTDE